MELNIGTRFSPNDLKNLRCPACRHQLQLQEDFYGEIIDDDFEIECSNCGTSAKFAAVEYVLNSFDVSNTEAPDNLSSEETRMLEQFIARHAPPDAPAPASQLPEGHTPKVWKTCRNGHLCEMTAKFCPECGGPL